MEPLELLAEAPGLPRWELPAELERLYAGGIGFEPPCLVANFIETLDGVVAIPDLPRSNSLIAAESEADRFVMGLLRACADVVLIGSGTMLASPAGRWRPDGVHPPSASLFAKLRAARGLAEAPRVAVVTAGGSFDASHPVVAAGALVLTTERAAPDLSASVPTSAEVVPVNDDEAVDAGAAVALLHARGYGVVLSEAGPTLTASLLASDVVDELFLTLSPLVAGRATSPRLGLVDGVELLPDVRVGGELRSVRRGGSHLLLRYALSRL